MGWVGWRRLWVCCGFIFVCDFGGWGLGGGDGGCECVWWWPEAVGVGSGYGFVGSRKDEMRIKLIIK